MSYQSAPFWWLVCDAPDCKAKSSEGSEYCAWSDKSGAEGDAVDAEWLVGDKHHYCPEHRRYVCGECEKSEGREYPLDQDGMCDECWAEDAKQDRAPA